MSDEKKLTLSPRGTLGVTKGVETGQVRQSFSHGRTKSVVVERKKKRVLSKGAVEAPVSADTKIEVKKPQPAFKPKKSPMAKPGGLSSIEVQNRAKVLGEAKKRAEAEAVLAAERAKADEVQRKVDDERKRKDAAEKAALDAARTDEQVADDDAATLAATEAKKKSEEAAQEKLSQDADKKVANDMVAREEAEEAARKKTDLEARAVQLRKAFEAAKADASVVSDDDAARKKGKPKRGKDKKSTSEADAKRNANVRGNDKNRGKLTISRALAGEEGRRQRSLASYKRKQAKNRRQADGGEKVKVSREVILPEVINVQELAKRMGEKANAVIKVLMGMGVMATINENLELDTAELVIEEFGHTVKRVSEADVEIGMFGADDADADLIQRAPVVTVMGHVDHGKTSLLDALREQNVVDGEAGGITQHIGAYQVTMPGGDKITFLDTPGHAAFTEMRARGASCTDIVVLVVAADDGVMPQTIEAINHAKAAGVPIIVAINKMDREGADPDRVRQELLQHEVVTEHFSGDVQEVEVSALKRTGLDKLKDAIHMQAELAELTANPNRSAEGVVIEAKLDKGRGPVATVLVQRGSLKIGDIFVAGAQWGKVRALMNDQGQQISEAGPSLPVEILGAGAAPAAGDDFAVVDSEAKAREIVEYRQGQVKKKRAVATAAPKTLEGMFTQLKANEIHEFQVILKADVQGSVEAITTALEKIGNDDIRCRVLHGGVGGITESDITLAHASGAMIMGFNVRPNRQARELAEQEGVPFKFYSIIYNLIDDVRAAMIGELGPEFNENIIGAATIKDVFSAGKHGRAAGCLVIEGHIRSDAKARILRDDVIIYEGGIDNLRRFKDDVKRVESGQECGLTFDNYQDFKANDILEIYELFEVERKLA